MFWPRLEATETVAYPDEHISHPKSIAESMANHDCRFFDTMNLGSDRLDQLKWS